MSIKVFVPHKRNANSFFDELERYSDFQFHYRDDQVFDSSYGLVLIHWPEQLIDRTADYEQEMQGLIDRLNGWREQAKVVYFVHNERSHDPDNDNYSEVYRLVEERTDLFVHLGSFSKTKFDQNYSGVPSVLLPHPLYESSFQQLDPLEAKKNLGYSNSTLIVVPGRIRSSKEHHTIMEAFRQLDQADKHLCVIRMYHAKQKEYLGKYFLKRVKRRLQGIFSLGKKQQKDVSYNYGFMPPDQLSTFMSAADVIWIPRISGINSGLVYLAMTFQKPVVGPALGNIAELLARFGMPGYDYPTNSGSIAHALQKGIQLAKASHLYDPSLLNEYRPSRIGPIMDRHFKELLNSSLNV